MSNHYLPSKLHSYLKRLLAEYRDSNQTNYIEILSSSRVYLVEETDYDDWNGGTYGHDVKFFLPEPILVKIKIREQEAFTKRILEDLNICAEAVNNEFFRKVLFEPNDENDKEYLRAIPLSQKVEVNPDSLSIWHAGQIRLFISHRDGHKIAANELATALRDYGISAFVAHDSIEPMTSWQQEIIRGLDTMEIMLAFVTDDFHASSWTNQEIGYALGRNIPVISLKLQKADPVGFISNIQALKGNIDSPISRVKEIYQLLSERFGNKKRLQNALVTAFVESTNFDEARIRFDRLKGVVESLTEDELLKIIQGYEENNQLHNAIYLNNQYHRLKNLLQKTTGKDFLIQGNIIKVINDEDFENIPF